MRDSSSTGAEHSTRTVPAFGNSSMKSSRTRADDAGIVSLKDDRPYLNVQSTALLSFVICTVVIYRWPGTEPLANGRRRSPACEAVAQKQRAAPNNNVNFMISCLKCGERRGRIH